MAEDKGPDPTPAEIIAALERTGFLLEQRAAQKLQDAGFIVTTNDAFPDSDTGKSREIDIVANIHDPFYESDIGVSVTVIMECKNYSVPLVVMGKKRRTTSQHHRSVHLTFDPFSSGDRATTPGRCRRHAGHTVYIQ